MKRIPKGFSEDGAVWVRNRNFALKIHALFEADAFCGLHNDKYTKY